MDMDQAFIDMMVPHHETAVAAAKVIGTSTERSELKQVAEDMIVWEVSALLGNEKCVHELGPIASGSGH